MYTYLDIARDIHSWLGSLQIKQKWIDAHPLDGQLAYDLFHPVKGTIKVKQFLPPERIFRSKGVALEAGEPSGAKTRLRVYDFGGIYDPIDEHVPGEHYATTHFALLSALLFSATKDTRYIEPAIAAMEFHLYTSPDEYKLSNWMYHWDFQNYAFAATFDLLKSHLPEKVRNQWRIGLRAGQTNHRNKLTNWAAMRALAHLQRCKTVGPLTEMARYFWNMRTVSRARQADGCMDDHKNVSRPIQYHIYAAALLHRIYLLNKSRRALKWFLTGVDYLMPWIDPDGDFNYWGRGQEQIFGFGAAIYALEAAALVTGNRQKYQRAAESLFRFLLQYKTGEHFPLVLNSRRDDEQYGWYDYHHTTVYNAFLGVWLAFAHNLSQETETRRQAAIGASSSSFDFSNREANDAGNAHARLTYFKPTRIVFIANDHFFCAIGEGLKSYLSEVGLTPCHLWMEGVGWLFSCPGGPTADTFGKRRHHPGVHENFVAPLAIPVDGQILHPATGAGRFERVSQQEIIVRWRNDYYEISRRFVLAGRAFSIDDEIRFLRTADFSEFRFFNFPVVTDKFEIGFDDEALILSTENGARARIEMKHDFAVKSFRTNPKLKTAKGEAQIVRKSALDFHATRGESKRVVLRILPLSRAQGRRIVDEALFMKGAAV
jgi:hypothetical protein